MWVRTNLFVFSFLMGPVHIHLLHYEPLAFLSFSLFIQKPFYRLFSSFHPALIHLHPLYSSFPFRQEVFESLVKLSQYSPSLFRKNEDGGGGEGWILHGAERVPLQSC